MKVGTRSGSTPLKVSARIRAIAASVPRLLRRCDTFCALARFSEDPDTMRDLVHLDDDGVGETAEPFDRVRRAVRV